MKRWLAHNKGFVVFLLCFGVFRTAIADWNPIPSGSMRPTLLEGDVVFVNRLAYNIKLPLTDIVIAPLSDPQRGDIVTFSSPRDGTRLIKRIVGVPGDRVEMRGDTLTVNGVAARYDALWQAPDPVAPGRTLDSVHATEHLAGSERSVQFLPAVHARRDMAALVVPPGHYFMLGDNRDNSADSRYFGFFPRSEVMGRTRRVAYSLDPDHFYLPRIDRFGVALDAVAAAAKLPAY